MLSKGNVHYTSLRQTDASSGVPRNISCLPTVCIITYDLDDEYSRLNDQSL